MYTIGRRATSMPFCFIGAYMKIIALSDQHGNLESIKESCDVVVIAGDWSPLYCQQDFISVLNWWDKRFLPWMKTLKTDHIIVIPGNHDFACTYKFFEEELNKVLSRHKMTNKVNYLCKSSVTIGGKKFYGNPNSESPSGWAFSMPYNQTYEFDEDTDILITHQPPRFGNVGFVKQFNKELGSVDLRNEILRSNIDLNICGHIHTGDHNLTPAILNNGKVATIANVSILDEDYRVAYNPLVIEV